SFCIQTPLRRHHLCAAVRAPRGRSECPQLQRAMDRTGPAAGRNLRRCRRSDHLLLPAVHSRPATRAWGPEVGPGCTCLLDHGQAGTRRGIAEGCSWTVNLEPKLKSPTCENVPFLQKHIRAQVSLATKK